MGLRSSRTPIGVEVGGQTLNAVQLSRSGARWTVEASVSLPRREEGAMPGRDEIALLADVLGRQGFRGRSVVLAMPQERLMTEVVAVGRQGPGSGSADLIRDKLAKAHRCDPAAIELAWWALPGKGSADVMAVACRHDEAGTLLDAFENAGLSVRAIDVLSLALARACRTLVPEGNAPIAILSVGWSVTTIVVVHAGAVVYARNLSDSSVGLLDRALRETLSVERDVAMYILQEMGLQASGAEVDGTKLELPDEVQVQVGVFLDKLVNEMRLSLNYVSRESGDKAIEQLLVVGEGATVPGLVDHLASSLALEARLVAPADVAECRSRGGSPALSAALGLAQHGSPS